MSSTLTELQKKQIEQAEEILFSGPEKEGFAKELFFGHSAPIDDSISRADAQARAITDQAVEEVKEFCLRTSIRIKSTARRTFLIRSCRRDWGDLASWGSRSLGNSVDEGCRSWRIAESWK